ncbi:MAG: PP2C family protein-serine/threonine phosphatase [Cyclobacteriaceae bacterium]
MKSLVFSHRGKRKTNQDYVLIQNINPDTHLFLIADGMGGYENGDVAAKIVVENIHTYLSNVQEIEVQHIQKAINKANLLIKQLRDKKQMKIGATVGGLILNELKSFLFWVGDVKIFHFRDNALLFETPAHTLMNEVIESGAISNIKQINKYRHIVTRSVQGDIELSQADTRIIERPHEKDLFIICSDGVHDIYDSIQIQQLFKASNVIDEAMSAIEQRLKSEATDNFSMIAIANN